MTVPRASVIENAVKRAIRAAQKAGLDPIRIRVGFPDGKVIVEILETMPRGTMPAKHVARRVHARMYLRMRSAHPWLETTLRWDALTGYTLEQLCRHLSSKFRDGMSWDNIADWHIDHIRPLASFQIDRTDCPAFYEAWALRNLQPLWARDNLSKGARWG